MEKKYIKIMANKLFNNISGKEFNSMLTCLMAFEKKYGKNEIIINEGESINFVGAVLEGAVKILKTDYNGNEFISSKGEKIEAGYG